jgi:hypothetical protein
MTTLSARAERGDDARELLDALYQMRFGHPAIHEYRQPDGQRGTTFLRLLDINTPEAHLAAAMMLVPEGCEWELTTLYGVARVGINLNHGPDDGPSYGESLMNSPAHALIAAIARMEESNER